LCVGEIEVFEEMILLLLFMWEEEEVGGLWMMFLYVRKKRNGRSLTKFSVFLGCM
jgi:hypothetical protein